MTAPDLRPPLVVLHGALGAAAQFTALTPLLVAHFRVVTLDFRGHGPRPVSLDSDGTPDGAPWRLTRFVDDLAALIQAENLAPARVFGYSMGGYAALALAARAPELVQSVLTLGTKFEWDAPTAAQAAAWLDPAAMRAKVPAFADALAARHHAGSGWEAVVRGTADVLRDLGRAPLLGAAVLATIGQPVRVLVGDRDATVSVEETAAAYRALPAGQLGVLPGTAHPFERLSPAALVAHLLEFFAPAGA